jgi:glucose uptake protein GlcU
VVLGYMTVGPGRKLSRADLQLWQCGVPGALSGVAWSLANSCGILGAHYMGMALAFPLTQTATILSGMWGLFIFRELKTRLAAGVFLFAMVMAAAGALLLALFGRASAPWG